MRIVFFTHSLASDWNHGNAHFLRGVASELQRRGHDVAVFEPRDAWSVRNLVEEHGDAALLGYRRAYPRLTSVRYGDDLDLGQALDRADIVLVHEWNDHGLVQRIGQHRASAPRPYALLFHDTHHRAVTEPASMAAYDLSHYDGVLAFGDVIRRLYVERGWTRRAWTWHEAADTRVFHPLAGLEKAGDLVWIGNWGDEERSAELHEFLIEPVKRLGLSATVYGVRYPESALAALRDAGIVYGGWLPNYMAPEVFARHRVTVHVPRRPYVEALPGIPTIRVFEALACGIPLVSAPWTDAEGLFTAGDDYLVARNGAEMAEMLRAVLSDDALAARLSASGPAAIARRHTCAHRVDELLSIHESVRAETAESRA